jgi:NTE family protein
MGKRERKTAFVLAGGGSLGAVQVGMLEALLEAGQVADLVVGSSVGALNAGFFAGDPTPAGVKNRARIWRGLRRDDIFPLTLRSALRWLGSADALFESASLRRLIKSNLSYANLEDAPVPLHVVATSLGGAPVCLSSGPAVEAILASAAIPVVFPTVEIGIDHLMDGAISGNTPILTAVELGADRLIVLPTGFACALSHPPRGAVARGFHALTLLIAHQMLRDLASVSRTVEVLTVPNLCPLNVSPFDFGQTEMLLERSANATRAWIADGGLSRPQAPNSLRAQTHG